MLAKSEAVQIPLRPSVPIPANFRGINSLKPMQADYAKVADRLEEVIKLLQPILGL